MSDPRHGNPKHQGLVLVRRTLLVAASMTVGIIGWYMLGDSDSLVAAETPSADVVARVDGVDISRDQVLDDVADELIRLELERRELLDEALEERISDLLIRREAERRQISLEQLLAAEIDGKLGEIDADSVVAYHASHWSLDGPRLADVEHEIRSQLRYQAFVAELEASTEVDRIGPPASATASGASATVMADLVDRSSARR